MQTALEVFFENMQDDVMKQWFEAMPRAIQYMAKKFPYKKYRMRADSPYGMPGPGQIVHLRAYTDLHRVEIVVKHSEFTSQTIQHIYRMCETHGRDYTVMRHTDFRFIVETFYLEPIE